MSWSIVSKAVLRLSRTKMAERTRVDREKNVVVHLQQSRFCTMQCFEGSDLKPDWNLSKMVNEINGRLEIGL